MQIVRAEDKKKREGINCDYAVGGGRARKKTDGVTSRGGEHEVIKDGDEMTFRGVNCEIKE